MPLVLTLHMSHDQPTLRDPFTSAEIPPPYSNHDLPGAPPMRADSMVETATYGSASSSSPEARRPGSWSSRASTSGAPTPSRRRRSKAHTPNACNNCKKAHLGCDSERPCKRCVVTGKQHTCADVPQKRRGRPRLRSHPVPPPTPDVDTAQLPTGTSGIGTPDRPHDLLIPTALLSPSLDILHADHAFTALLGRARALPDIARFDPARLAPGGTVLLSVVLRSGPCVLSASVGPGPTGLMLRLPPIERAQLASLSMARTESGSSLETLEGSPVAPKVGESPRTERVEAERKETRKRMEIGSLLG